MKYIVLAVGLLVMGCGSRESSLVGHYTSNNGMKLYLRSDNVAEFQDIVSGRTGDWKIEDGELVTKWTGRGAFIFRIEEQEPNLLWIANIVPVKGEMSGGVRVHYKESEYIRFYRQHEKDKDKDQ